MKYLKYLLVILIILLIIGGGYFFGYNCDLQPQNWLSKIIYSLKCGKTMPPNQETPMPPSVSQNTNQQGIEQNNTNQLNINNKYSVIYNDETIDYSISELGEVILLNKFGKVIKIKNKEQETIITNLNVFPKNINITKDGSKIVFDLNNIISIFDVNSKKWRQLEQESFAPFISESNELFYFVKKQGDSVDLMKIDLNKENASSQKLINLNALNYKIISKNKDSILLASNPSSIDIGSVLEFNTKTKNLSLIYELPGLIFKWNEKFNLGLMFTTNNFNNYKGGVLTLLNKNEENKTFSFLTLPSKCDFREFKNKEAVLQTTINTTTTLNNEEAKNQSNNIQLICAVPQDQEKLKYQRFVDDYLTKELYTEDNVYLINLSDQTMNIVWSSNNDYFDMNNVKVFNNKLFFINRFDNKLYSIDI